MAARGGGKILKFEIMRGKTRADPNSNSLANSIFNREKNFFFRDRRTSLFFSVFYFRKKNKITSGKFSFEFEFRVSRKKRE